MRRIKILFFWFFCKKNNVSFNELIKFLIKPQVHTIAQKSIKNIVKKDMYEVEFNTINHKLFWPNEFSIDRLDQVTAETFDKDDWHYYQKRYTEITQDEYLLDIGTAEGLFSLTVVEKCKHIYLVEPSKIFNKSLEKTFFPFKNKISILNIAVGNMDGVINFDENSLDGMVNTTLTSSENQISINKIDTLFSNKEKITYLKADIEGFEEEMLKGAELTIKRNKPKIAITSYHTQNNPMEIISLIKGFVPEYNYYVKGIYEKTPKPVLIHFWI